MPAALLRCCGPELEVCCVYDNSRIPRERCTYLAAKETIIVSSCKAYGYVERKYYFNLNVSKNAHLKACIFFDLA